MGKIKIPKFDQPKPRNPREKLSMDASSGGESSMSILMLPWLAHGHISPFFELAKRLSLRNLKIYFCSTPINLKPIRNNNLHKDFPLIQLVELHLPSSFHDVLPPHYHTTKNLPPHLMSTLKTAFDEAKPAYCDILKAFKPNLVIYDFIQPWASDLARDVLNVKAVLFLTPSASASALFSHFYMYDQEKEFPFPEFHFPEAERRELTNFLQYEDNGVKNGDRYLGSAERSHKVILIKTSREIEAKYMDYHSGLLGKELVAVGPLVQEPPKGKDGDDVDSWTLNWLSKREPGSVVYVSFGSEYFLSKEQMEEVAHGLESSKLGFIWVVRFPGRDDHECKKIIKGGHHEGFPLGFLDRVQDRGLVVEGWAPQAKILASPNTGGFVSHCGWSSVLELITSGVPIIAMPMQLDQPLNARLVVNIGVGVEVPRENGRLSGENMTKVINQVLLEGGGGKVRGRAREMCGKLKESGEEEMVLAVKKLVQLADTVT